MAVEQNIEFSHRNNYDGTYDSICKTCFKTVSNRAVEAELYEDESNHRCEPYDIIARKRIEVISKPPLEHL